MGSFYDYIPVVGPVVRAAQGDWKDAGIDLGGPFVRGGYDYAKAVHGANQEQKQGYYGMADQAKALGADQKAFQMQGLNQAEGYFAPARSRLNAMYGSTGDPVPQTPAPPPDPMAAAGKIGAKVGAAAGKYFA